MKKKSARFSNYKKLLLQSGLILLLFNILYFAFFFQREYQTFSIHTDITVSNPTTVWYVYKNKYSEERIFSNRIQIQPNKEKGFDFEINTKNEIDYIGLFWQAKEKSTIKLASYNFTIDQKTFKSKNNRSIIHYTSKGSLITNTKTGVNVQSTTSKRNWIMLNDATFLNEKRDYKKHSIIPLIANLALLISIFVLLFFNNATTSSLSIKPIKFSLQNIKFYLLVLWAFLVPFWIIISHTLLVVLAVITIIESCNKKQFTKLLTYVKSNILFVFLFLWIVIASIFTSTSNQIMDNLLDYSYLLLMPLVFFKMNKTQMERIGNYFQLGLSFYFVLLIVFTLLNFMQQETDYTFIRFLELNLEKFWHTSYFSFLILIVFVFKLKTPLKNNIYLGLFYLVAILFMYFMHARLPLIVGLLLLAFRIFKYAKSAKTKIIFTIILGCITTGLFVYFITKAPIENNSNIGDVNNLDARLSIWNASFSEIKNNFIFGVGSDNTRDAISNAISDNVNTKFRNYNCHNQFIEMFLAHGFLAFLLFVVIFYNLFKKSNIHAKAFVFCCVILFLVESYIQRQAGIVLFSFWYCYFFNLAHNNDEAYTN
ncbi:MAG: O-antigen ligase family protein [Oceanihabitans sp.]